MGNMRKKSAFLILHCSVLLQISIGEMIYTVQWSMHSQNQKL